MIERSIRTVLFSAVLSVTLAFECFAVAIDPVPLYKTATVPPERRLSTERSTLFLCPQTKHFGNGVDKVVVETLMMEALGEGFAGMVAVGEVVRNRTRLFSKAPADVCLMPKQFSCWNDPGRPETFVGRYRAHYLVAAMAWWVSAHTRLTGGATDYHAVHVSPYWAKAYQRSSRIGRHIFYTR